MNLNKSNIIIFLGPPGAGKGTLSKLFVDKLNWIQLSTGDILRENISNKTELGEKVDFIIKSGKLISDELIIQIVKDWLLKNLKDSSKVILDGFPRTENQAIELKKMLASSLKNTDLILIRLKISESVLVSRLLNRTICSNQECKAIYSLVQYKEPLCSLCSSKLTIRPDDELNAIKDRLKLYSQNENLILDIFKRSGIKIIDIDVEKPIQEIYKDLLIKLNIYDNNKK